MNNFTFAFGKIIVPISLPSTKMPFLTRGFSPKFLWIFTTIFLTSGIDAIIDEYLSISGLRISFSFIELISKILASEIASCFIKFSPYLLMVFRAKPL